ncbi:MAG: hypothetical protein MJE68_23120 [Proteobacteria bacterium]|nr:hypothetical protein [Pseudomonadota bacterium]
MHVAPVVRVVLPAASVTVAAPAVMAVAIVLTRGAALPKKRLRRFAAAVR